MAYPNVLAGAWRILMYFFGLYFPEPFPVSPRWSLRSQGWKIWLWIGAIPLAFFSLAETVVRIGEVNNYERVAPIYRMAVPFRGYLQVMAYILVSTFFSAIGMKSVLAISAEAKRRLRFFDLGTSL